MGLEVRDRHLGAHDGGAWQLKIEERALAAFDGASS
jgi:hypothetical protein